MEGMEIVVWGLFWPPIPRVAIWHYGSPSHRVVEQQLMIPGFLPEFLETSGDQENLRFLEKVATRN